MNRGPSPSALSEAERRYDVIPDAVRENIRAGGAERRALVEADAQTEFFKYLIASQTKAIHYHRRRGEPVPAHKLDDFQMYRRQYRWWHGELMRLTKAASVEIRSAA